jgi:hypothetical protein
MLKNIDMFRITSTNLPLSSSEQDNVDDTLQNTLNSSDELDVDDDYESDGSDESDETNEAQNGNGAVALPGVIPIEQFGNYRYTTVAPHTNLHLGHDEDNQAMFFRIVRGDNPNDIALFNSRELPVLRAINALTSARIENGIAPPHFLFTFREHLINPVNGDNLVCFISEIHLTRLCSLSNFINSRNNGLGLSEPLAIYFFLSIARSVLYCHNAGVCVSDITPNRIVVYQHEVNGNIQFGVIFADLSGSITVPESGITSNRSGTPAFVSPEKIMQTFYNSYASDAWTLGVFLHVLLTGRVPWPSTASTPAQLFALINGTIPVNLFENTQVSPQARELVVGLMNRNPIQRITVSNAIHRAAAILSIPANMQIGIAAAHQNIDRDPKCGEN